MSFIPGLHLGEMYYREILLPFLQVHCPSTPHAAALIGPGSEILGFDTAVSTDHDWYPRALVFLPNATDERQIEELNQKLRREQPKIFHGYTTPPDNSPDIRFRLITTVDAFWRAYLGFPSDVAPQPTEWLTFPEHRLLCLTSGTIYHDGTGELTVARRQYAYYPDDVWFYMLSAQWQKLSQESVFVSRCGDSGDELGSRVLAARILKEVMRLCFLMERHYAPYSKWLGRAFTDLPCAAALRSLMKDVLTKDEWRGREKSLTVLYEKVAAEFNTRGLVEIVPVKVVSYHGRPYRVINAEDFTEACHRAIKDPAVKAFKRGLGSADQLTDTVDMLCDPWQSRKLQAVY